MCLLPQRAVLAGLVAMLVACGPPQRIDSTVTPDGGRLFTANDIAKMHVSTAWDVMRRIGDFNLQPATEGMPARVTTRRGHNSLLLASADEPVFLLDGVRFEDAGILQQISAGSIAELRIYDGIQATLKQGTNSGAGLIEIRTKSAPDSE
jgi:hypothetical protein